MAHYNVFAAKSQMFQLFVMKICGVNLKERAESDGTKQILKPLTILRATKENINKLRLHP